MPSNEGKQSLKKLSCVLLLLDYNGDLLALQQQNQTQEFPTISKHHGDQYLRSFCQWQPIMFTQCEKHPCMKQRAWIPQDFSKLFQQLWHIWPGQKQLQHLLALFVQCVVPPPPAPPSAFLLVYHCCPISKWQNYPAWYYREASLCDFHGTRPKSFRLYQNITETSTSETFANDSQ